MVFLAIVAPIEVQEKRRQDLLGIKLVGTALLIWSSDNDDRFPKPGENIAALLAPYLKDKSLVQRLKNKDWLVNEALRGRTFLEIKDLSKVVMLYESAGGKGLGPGRRKLIVFADGSASLADAARLGQVRWTIKR